MSDKKKSVNWTAHWIASTTNFCRFPDQITLVMATRAEKEAVLDFAKYCDQRVRVRFQGGREVDGVLKGYDKLDNLVLEDSIEYLRGKIPVFFYQILHFRLFDCLSS